MKHIRLVVALMIATFVIAGCQNTKKPKANAEVETSDNEQVADNDSTVYGVEIAAAMHSLEMKGTDGKMYHFLKDMDDSACVFGGLLDGDQLAVTYRVEKNEFGADTIATKIINLTTLQAHWQSLDKDFELLKGGEVKSHQEGETRPWTSWRILNGHLLLNKDTFDITMLGPDSLFLEDKEGIYNYKRAK